jgi:ribosomal protein S18 acetylase RimI-like enzyme
VDTNVVFEKPIAPAHEFAGYCAVRFVIPSDERQVVELARRSFVYSRFHLDSAIPKAVADTVKAEWVASYFAGKRGDEMVIALVDETVVGFLLLLWGNDGVLTIDLIAVDGNQRRKGIASDMITYAESQCHGCSRIKVGTQLANIPSIRLYEKIGFRMCMSKYVFHYHNLPVEAR